MSISESIRSRSAASSALPRDREPTLCSTSNRSRAPHRGADPRVSNSTEADRERYRRSSVPKGPIPVPRSPPPSADRPAPRRRVPGRRRPTSRPAAPRALTDVPASIPKGPPRRALALGTCIASAIPRQALHQVDVTRPLRRGVGEEHVVTPEELLLRGRLGRLPGEVARRTATGPRRSLVTLRYGPYDPDTRENRGRGGGRQLVSRHYRSPHHCGSCFLRSWHERSAATMFVGSSARLGSIRIATTWSAVSFTSDRPQ
jgi:hypothetical protein